MKFFHVFIAVLFLPLPATARPLVPVMNAAEISKQCDVTFARASQSVRKMQAKPRADGIFDEWNRLQIDI